MKFFQMDPVKVFAPGLMAYTKAVGAQHVAISSSGAGAEIRVELTFADSRKSVEAKFFPENFIHDVTAWIATLDTRVARRRRRFKSRASKLRWGRPL